MTPVRRFRNRVEAGRKLSEALRQFCDRKDTIVLGLPRGGVPVAFEVAKELHVPLDVFVVRKLGVPGYEEVAMGAVASGGVRVLNQQAIEQFDVRPESVDAVAARETRELTRRESLYRGRKGSPQLANKVVIIVDDGMATGSTMRAAVEGVAAQEPRRVVVAVPVAAAAACAALSRIADEVVTLTAPDEFYAVGQWYEQFPQTSDDEVRTLLAIASGREQAARTGSKPTTQPQRINQER